MRGGWVFRWTSREGEALLEEGGEAFAPAVEMGADGVDGEAEGGGYALVAEVFLVKEDEDGALGRGEGEEGGFDGGGGFGLAEVLFGGAGVSAFEVAGGLVFEPGIGCVPFFVEGGGGGEVVAIAATALPFILGDIDGDAVEVGGEMGVAAEFGEGAVEAEKDFLGEVFELGSGAGEAVEGAEDEGLVLADEGFKAFRRCVVLAHASDGV